MRALSNTGLIVFYLMGVGTALGNVDAGLHVGELRCEYKVDPLGIDRARPRLSWTMLGTQADQEQTAYQILVASSPELLAAQQGDLWNSAKQATDQSVHVVYGGKALQSNQSCYWKLRVWDTQGRASAWSESARWTMALCAGSDWQAEWIRKPVSGLSDEAEGLPLFRKAFACRSGVKRALVHVCGLGHYELFLNGQKVGNRFLDPAWSVYEKTVYYNSYDVTNHLCSGTNAWGVMLGKGFYNTVGDRRVHGVDAQRPLGLILQAHIQYASGNEQVITSDSSWRVTPGPITHAAILGGSDYDARRLPASWCCADFDDSAWDASELYPGPPGRLTSTVAPPMQVFDRFRALRIDQPEPGVYVYDFGQNASAVPSIRVRGRAGQVLRLTPAEQRFGQARNTNNGKGRVNQAGVGKPNYWQYTLGSAADEEWIPQFTYGSFQFLELTGAVPLGQPNPEGLPVVHDLRSIHVRNACAQKGSFACSDALFNDIDRLIDWAVRSNMGHVLTDCPHREKLGWLEVSYLMGPAIARRYDLSSFYAKKCQDIRDSQDPNGLIYTVAPNYPAFQGGFRYTPEWGAAGVVLPWQVYRWYGDRRTLAESYASMKGFVDYMHASAQDLIPRAGLGDWYDYGHGKSMGPSRFTPVTLTAMATFYRCTQIVRRAAAVLGHHEDQYRYQDLAQHIKRKFNATYFNGHGAYQHQDSPQTANAMALALDMVDPEHESAVLERIVTDIRKRGNQQTAGDIGFYYLLEALGQHGRSDVIYDLARRRVEGSYGFILDRGWTSMPEAWNAHASASMNHCMLGHIQLWFYKYVLGIRQAPDSVGLKDFVVEPCLVGNLTWARGHYDSMYGRILVQWQRQEDRLVLNVTVPPNSTATISVPTLDRESVLESGRPISAQKDLQFLGWKAGRARYRVPSGRYCFSARISRSPEK
jgi:alpha-L-rhamnosidase